MLKIYLLVSNLSSEPVLQSVHRDFSEHHKLM